MRVKNICRYPGLAAAGQRIGLLFAVVTLTACQGDFVLSPATPQPDVKDKFPIDVQASVESLVLPRSADVEGLGETEAARIGNFAGNYLRSGHGALTISIPSGGDVAGRIDAINEVMFARGVRKASVEWQMQEPSSDAASAIVLSYTRFKAMTSPCGHWEQDMGRDPGNQPWANFGCAQQHNLAVMLADPLDLKRPRRMTLPDSARRNTVLENYRRGEPTETRRTSQESGTISEATEE